MINKADNIDEMSIFRFLRKAAIINSVSKMKYTEWVAERLKEEALDTINWEVKPLMLKGSDNRKTIKRKLKQCKRTSKKVKRQKTTEKVRIIKPQAINKVHKFDKSCPNKFNQE